MRVPIRGGREEGGGRGVLREIVRWVQLWRVGVRVMRPVIGGGRVKREAAAAETRTWWEGGMRFRGV